MLHVLYCSRRYVSSTIPGDTICQGVRFGLPFYVTGTGAAHAQVVALVGPSGGGKSSIVKLVQRIYLPSTGEVLLDGVDVGAYDPRWLQRRVALVAQVRA